MHPITNLATEKLINFVVAPNYVSYSKFVHNAPKHKRLTYIYLNEAIRMEGWLHCYMTITFLEGFEKHPEWNEIRKVLHRCYPLINSPL